MKIRRYSALTSPSFKGSRLNLRYVALHYCVLIGLAMQASYVEASCDGLDYRMFDKLIGEWKQYQLETDAQVPIGILNRQMVAGGCAIRQSYKAAIITDTLDNRSFESFVYLADKGYWNEVYVYSDGSKPKRYQWEQSEEEFILEEIGKASINKQRWVITDIRDDQYLVIDERSENRGQTWLQKRRTKFVRAIEAPLAHSDTKDRPLN